MTNNKKDVTQFLAAGNNITANSILRCSLGVSSIIFTLFQSFAMMRGIEPPTWYLIMATSCIAATAGVSLPFSIVRREQTKFEDVVDVIERRR